MVPLPGCCDMLQTPLRFDFSQGLNQLRFQVQSQFLTAELMCTKLAVHPGDAESQRHIADRPMALVYEVGSTSRRR
jgi:hypothetical protein